MKTRVYMRVARGMRGPKVDASTRPDQRPITDSRGDPLDTAHFAIDLVIPEEAFKPRVIAKIEFDPEVWEPLPIEAEPVPDTGPKAIPA